jgi:hypothetical protein
MPLSSWTKPGALICLRWCAALASLVWLHFGGAVTAQERQARVSPVLEIEVIDPNVDSRGNPAVVVTQDGLGRQQVEIPPALIVHRYYYTGDRSFRGPDLPGGPSIIIAQNPRNGQQVYLPVQMLPGSPIVKYSSRSIEYDFGNHAVIVAFPQVGEPVVSYRNGRPLDERMASAVGLNHVSNAWKQTSTSLTEVRERSHLAFKATHGAAEGVLRPLTLPLQNMARLVPGHAALSDPQLSQRVAEQAELRKRDAELHAQEHRQALDRAEVPRF